MNREQLIKKIKNKIYEISDKVFSDSTLRLQAREILELIEAQGFHLVRKDAVEIVDRNELFATIIQSGKPALTKDMIL